MSVSVADPVLAQAGAAQRALRRAIVRGRGFSLLLCTCDAPASRDQYIADLAASLPALTIHRIALADHADDLLEALAERLPAGTPAAAMVLGIEQCLQTAEPAARLLATLNLQRAEWPKRIAHPVVFWLPQRLLGRLTSGAPDFFDWRSDSIAFPELSRVAQRPLGCREWTFGVDPRFSWQEQRERATELEARLALSHDAIDEGVVRSRLGWWDELAELMLVRGDIDQALRIRTEEELPVYKRLGDVRAKAATQGKIADLLQAHGELDAALRIRTEEELPVYERLGAVHDLLVCRAEIAVGLLLRGAKTGDPADRERANTLLCQALAAARALRLPEAGQIAQILDQAGMACEEAGALRGQIGSSDAPDDDRP